MPETPAASKSTKYAEVEQYRHECEVREVIKKRIADRLNALEYLNLVEQKRGKKAGDRLRNDVLTQWRLGNRGEHGDWRET